jgi:hypothetical protein
MANGNALLHAIPADLDDRAEDAESPPTLRCIYLYDVRRGRWLAARDPASERHKTAPEGEGELEQSGIRHRDEIEGV